MNAQAQQALDELKRTFGGSGLFAALRNHHVFHFPSDEVVEEAFQRLPDADKWEFFISHMVANSYYHLSEMIVGLAMMRGVDQDDPAAGFEKIGALTIKVADKFRDFFGDCISAIMEERVASESDQLQMVEVADPPKLSVVAIPFYIDDSELPTPSN